jgi:DNA excision repair protein ERCC-4
MKTLPTIIVDSREQAPWEFSPEVAATVRQALPTGDYSLAGLESTVAIERKSLADFIGSVIHDWARFRRELRRLSAMDVACIIVECNVGDILAKAYTSDVAPLSLIGRAHGILIDYAVPVLFAGPRPVARLHAERLLLLAYKKLNNRERKDE